MNEDEDLAVFFMLRFVFSGVLLVASLAAVGICGSRIVSFFFLHDNFVLEQSHQVCEMPLNNRCVTHYVIRRTDRGVGDLVPFWVEYGDGKWVPGMQFRKSHYGFVYQINGSIEHWRLLGSQVTMALLGVLGLMIWFAVGGLQVLRVWGKSFFDQFSVD